MSKTKTIKTKKEFIADKKSEASDLRIDRRQLEKLSDLNYEDEMEYRFQSDRFLGEVYGVFEFMGWGEPPKLLTKNIEFTN